MENNIRLKCISITEGNIEEMVAFTVKKEGGYLGDYLAYKDKSGVIFSPALEDEAENLSKTYLIVDDVTNELAGYFSIKTGFVAINHGRFFRRNEFDAIPGIELANFATNDAYRQAHPNYKNVGHMIFVDYILPKVYEVQKLVGVKILYLFALPRESLIERYTLYGFSKLSVFQQRNMHRRFKPSYDRGCIFMYQLL